MHTNMRRHETGFTLVELLVVVAIVGVLAAIAIPNLMTAMQRAKQKRTMADMRAIGMAWESRAVDQGSYGAAGAGISLCCTVSVSTSQALGNLEPTYISPLPRTDGWSHPFEFSLNDDDTQYLIRSWGNHSVRDTDVMGGGTNHLDCDILYSMGQFIQYPEGIQAQ